MAEAPANDAFAAPAGAGGMVNTLNGNRMSTYPLVDWPSRGASGVEFTLVHNSLSTYSHELGVGWTHSYDVSVTYGNDLATIRELGDRKESLNRDLLKAEGLDPLPGAAAFIAALNAAGIPVSLGSSTPRLNIEVCLALAGLDESALRNTPDLPWGADAERRWLAAGGEPPRPLAALQGRPLLAMAGIAVPERFFSALEAAGLRIERLPLADHHPYDGAAPWPAGTREVVTTEKDAVKLARWAGGDVAIWVVGLDLALPADFMAALQARLARARAP